MGFKTGNGNRPDWAVRHSVLLAAVVAAALSLAAQLAGPDVVTALRYERGPIESGDWWRLLSANLVHLGLSHWLLNALALLLIALLFHRDATLGGAALATLLSAVAVTTGLYVATPSLDWYVGMSGVLHGLVAAGIVGTKSGWRRPDSWVLAAGLVLKLAFEQWHGPMPGSASMAGGPVVVDAHAYGALGGVVAGFIARVWARRGRSV